MPLEVAYWIWKPVAVATLFAGALAARLLPGERLAQAAAVALALFSFTPIAALVGWPSWARLPDKSTWCPPPGAVRRRLAVGLYAHRDRDRLMPASAGGRAGARPGRQAPGRGAGWYAAWGAAAGSSCRLHPWQVIMLLVLAGLAAWPGGPGARRRAVLLVLRLA